jgi:hypothetical protein
MNIRKAHRLLNIRTFAAMVVALAPIAVHADSKKPRSLPEDYIPTQSYSSISANGITDSAIAVSGLRNGGMADIGFPVFSPSSPSLPSRPAQPASPNVTSPGCP